MEPLLAGESVFVAGGGISVGRACVELFLREGGQVAFLDHDRARVEAVRKATGALGYTCDIADRAAVKAALDDAAKQLGGLTALVNVASFTAVAPVAEVTEIDLDRMTAVNLKGYYWTTQAVIPHMLSAGHGSIVQLSSIAANKPAWGEAYSLFKGAQVTLAYQVANEYGPAIRSNALLAGLIEDSPRLRQVQTIPAIIGPVLADHPMGRAMHAAELARACLFLASPASAAINGAAIVADGGQTRTQPNLNAYQRDKRRPL